MNRLSLSCSCHYYSTYLVHYCLDIEPATFFSLAGSGEGSCFAFFETGVRETHTHPFLLFLYFEIKGEVVVVENKNPRVNEYDLKAGTVTLKLQAVIS